MRILLMNQFFWPDSAATSQLLTDLAVEMAARGHQVHVLCAEGSYAVASAERQPAVTIHRIPALPFTRESSAAFSPTSRSIWGRLGAGSPSPGPTLFLPSPPRPCSRSSAP